MATTKDGCIDSAKIETQVYPMPNVDFFVSPGIQNYPNTTVFISNLSSIGNWLYTWSFGDGGTETIRQPIDYEYGNYGIYNIRLSVFNEYCRGTVAKEIQILPPAPEAGFTPDTAECPPMEITFRNHSLYGDSYIWDFDDGTFSTEENPTHLFYQPKVHNVTLKVVGLAGEDEEKHTVTVFVYPQSLFNAYPVEAGSTDQLFRFVNNSQNAVRYLWDFGDGNTTTETDPAYVYGKVGEFDVSLYTWSQENCLDTLVIEKYINIWAGEGVIAYPNVFKWNGSGPTGGYWNEGEIDNTVFHPHFINVVEYQLLIYTRWGELIYESDDLYKGWDGYLNGKHKANQGVYAYKAIVKYIDGSQEVKIGDVTFLH